MASIQDVTVDALVLLQGVLDQIIEVVSVFGKNADDVSGVPVFTGSHAGQRHSKPAGVVAENAVEQRLSLIHISPIRR